MWYDCFNGCVRARSLDTAAQKKKERTTIGIYRFMFCYLCHYLLAGFRKIQDYLMEEKEFEGLKDYLFFLRLYFVIAEDSLYISTMYCSLL
jgi:hypothetical protein